ncbi:MAG: LysR family transcriptional regulator [Paracoccaceae bacterium]
MLSLDGMATRTPSLNWLRVFEAAARSESFARAAAQLNMSAAAVSQQIKALEGQLGTPLFRRHAHAVTLTDAGRAYYPVVQQSLLMLDTATSGLFGEVREQQVYVQSILLFAHGVLAPALPALRAAHPGVNLMLNTANIEAEFAHRFSDMQIVFGAAGLHGSENDLLVGETLYPVATPEIADQITGPADLLRFPLIEVASHRAGWPYVLDMLHLSAAGARYEFADNSLVAAVMAGAGPGIMLARSPASDVALGQAGLVPCLDGFSVPGQESYHLVYPSKASLRPAARAFRGWLLEYLKDDDLG